MRSTPILRTNLSLTPRTALTTPIDMRKAAELPQEIIVHVGRALIEMDSWPSWTSSSRPLKSLVIVCRSWHQALKFLFVDSIEIIDKSKLSPLAAYLVQRPAVASSVQQFRLQMSWRSHEVEKSIRDGALKMTYLAAWNALLLILILTTTLQRLNIHLDITSLPLPYSYCHLLAVIRRIYPLRGLVWRVYEHLPGDQVANRVAMGDKPGRDLLPATLGHEGLRNLERLDLAVVEIPANDALALQCTLPNLRSLAFYHSYVSQQDLAHLLQLCPHLISISLHESIDHLTDLDSILFPFAPHLRDLDVASREGDGGPKIDGFLRAADKLETLHFSSDLVSLEALPFLPTTLVYLAIDFFTNDPWPYIAPLILNRLDKLEGFQPSARLDDHDGQLSSESEEEGDMDGLEHADLQAIRREQTARQEWRRCRGPVRVRLLLPRSMFASQEYTGAMPRARRRVYRDLTASMVA